MIERNEIKIILRVKLDSWKSHCKLICFGKTNEDYDVEFKRLQESLNLDEKVAIWDYRSARFTTASKEFLNNNKNIIGLIVITSGQDVNAVRKVKITRITHLSNEINVNFSFDDFVLIDKANLKRIMQLTMDEKEIFLGVGARGVNQMCHYIRAGETFTNELNKLIAGSQETISSKILNLYKFDKYGLGSKIQNKTELSENYLSELDAKYSETPEFEEKIINQIKRPSELRTAIINIKGATCQICGYPGFKKKDDTIYAETHHMIELNKKVPKTLQSWNILVLCPLCHRKIHYAECESEYLDKHWRIILEDKEYII